MAQAASHQSSVPSITDGLAPKYHLSSKKVLQAYKTLRKGCAFHASKRVLWRNRHTLVFGSKNLHKFGRFEEPKSGNPSTIEDTKGVWGTYRLL